MATTPPPGPFPWSVSAIGGSVAEAGIPVSFASASSNTVIAAVAGEIIRVYRVLLVANAAANLTFQDGSTALSGAMALAANSPVVLPNCGIPWYQTSPGNAFNILSSTGAQISGTLWYLQS
jgi:hypothetical protein